MMSDHVFEALCRSSYGEFQEVQRSTEGWVAVQRGFMGGVQAEIRNQVVKSQKGITVI